MSATISRKQLVEAIKVLGLDPNAVLELHLFPTYATGTEIAKTLDGTDNKLGSVAMRAGEVPRRDFHIRIEGDE